ncbi:DeoR/GlpR family DNA-binding transcription regulator [Paenibacillus sp.]|uniref:DeoR/GlpR family DNA-binding transcription regulator n=1 Tax=Paenibacillus sp. TaxID=58172 RepID=UPI002D2D3D15|nr:DeoR/GlpR family DNA-binding transcription regulator [Paenibacillus sp.]HZG58517.1 DeoR/GlpR family DNA-binding transcription regulator [Paenibacillus sp.]
MSGGGGIGNGSGSAPALNERQQQMLERITLGGEAKIAELREAFAVTEMTIRRDLEKLEATGLVRRTFGGAIYVGRDVALQERAGHMIEEKLRIGRAAAALVRPGESIFIDGGTTTIEVARALPAGFDVTVVTNAMNVALELVAKQVPVLVTGGTLLESTSSLVGPVAAQTLSGMAFDRAFLGTTGVSAQHGFSNSNIYEAEVKKLAIRQAGETNVVLDHTKLGAKVLVSFAPLGGVTRIVTDRAPDAAWSRLLAEGGVEVLVG